jgi:hypothetical protein
MDATNPNERGEAPIHEALGGDDVAIRAGQDCDAAFYEHIPRPVLLPTGLPFCVRCGSGPENFAVRAHCLARP